MAIVNAATCPAVNTVSSVPERSSWAMLAGGMLLLGSTFSARFVSRSVRSKRSAGAEIWTSEDPGA